MNMVYPTVYLETSVIGYATSRASRDVVVAGRQRITHEWLTAQSKAYELFVSQLVIREASAGDKQAAHERLAFVSGIPSLAITEEAGNLAGELVERQFVPWTSVEDALHIAVAAVHGIKYLLTWNFTHIANVTMRQNIERVCSNQGYEPPLICTPEELTDAPES